MGMLSRRRDLFWPLAARAAVVNVWLALLSHFLLSCRWLTDSRPTFDPLDARGVPINGRVIGAQLTRPIVSPYKYTRKKVTNLFGF